MIPQDLVFGYLQPFSRFTRNGHATQLTRIWDNRYLKPMSGAAKEKPKFMEELPDSCPPAGAGPFDYESVFRFANCNPVTNDDFASHKVLEEKAKAEGKPPPRRPKDVTPCVWSATSLWLTREAALGIAALPRMRGKFKFLARVKITSECGVSVLKRSHISFWRYATFKPAVDSVEALLPEPPTAEKP
jgi:hypothetical protein